MTNCSFFKLLYRHILYSFSYGKYKYSIFFGFMALLALMKSLQLTHVESNSVGTFYWLFKDNGYISRLADYQVPFYWVFIQFFVLFLISDFLFQDLENNRSYLLMRCRSKVQYILSNICWIVVQTLFIFIGLFAVIYIVSSLTLGDFSLGESVYFQQNIASLMEMKESPGSLVLHMFTGFFLTTIVLSSIQLLCMQFFSPIISFFGVIILSSLSTFSDIKWLPAIHSMILKQNIFNIEHHLTLSYSIMYCIGLYAIVTILTILVFRKKDIL